MRNWNKQFVLEDDGLGILSIDCLKAVRNLRSAILEAAQTLSDSGLRQVVIVLEEPSVTEVRLRDEWERASRVLRPEITHRLKIVICREGDCQGLQHDLSREMRSRLNSRYRNRWQSKEHLNNPERQGDIYLPQPDLFYEILKVLVYQWFRGKGPMTSRWIAEEAVGCSYPTVAEALGRLGPWITRHSDRRVELKGFPRLEWEKLLVVSDMVRSTRRYWNRSGLQTRSFDSLTRRLLDLKRNDIAIGGVTGAKHYYRKLNITGDPRIDISIHCPGRRVDLDFVRSLDPALKEVKDPGEPADMVIHMIRRRMPFFKQEGSNEMRIADPVECLLDLHEARLEVQAEEFLKARIKAGAM